MHSCGCRGFLNPCHLFAKVNPQYRIHQKWHARLRSVGRPCKERCAAEDENVCRWPISRVLSVTASCHGRSFIYDADCSTPPAAYPKVRRFGPNPACPKTHSLLLSFAPDEVYPAESVTRIAGALLPHRFTLTWEVVASFTSQHPSNRSRSGGLLSVALALSSRTVGVPTIVPCGARTFLSANRMAANEMAGTQLSQRTPGHLQTSTDTAVKGSRSDPRTGSVSRARAGTRFKFFCSTGYQTPPSLRNIFKELETDLGISPATHGCLTSWAEQGVLLLNTVLTVRAHEANSHQKKGWEQLTDAVIQTVSDRSEAIFVLWGKPAQKKATLIDERHMIIQSAHPSPLSARRGFFGSKPFSAINAALRSTGETPIEWRLPEGTADGP
ncbi:hypothetical protein Pcinc_023988 [Petrolisthes cinctipes]|uniref:Uracil-DNA glycosylase-like domain-containing protein n=1 Tax=Petrolisthes cinctipes TaxID=88211 RepID=A0AAE1FB92_PETCI|nr:hypothetical protein Pcinc_023988 [Petrolisthes cinctipes]